MSRLSRERWQRLQQVFDAATELEPGERADYLSAACGEDATLRQQVDSLLAAEEDADRVVRAAIRAEADDVRARLPAGAEPPPGFTGPTSVIEAGRELGRYRLLRPLGEGGMGTVFLAEQSEPFERRVAIKVLRAGPSDPRALLRFEAEGQALARLQHPNIAQVFEAGSTEAGVPYLVMEHLAGEPITGYCDSRCLDLGARIDLMIEVSRGVQHAHRNGIIHRDLKPSNLLAVEVGGRPIPKIIDFGIAKAVHKPLTRETLETARELLGTPKYLSPEAVGGSGSFLELDVRADVYALGVVLYELLVGRGPFEREEDSLFELLRRLSSEDPMKPSALLRGLPAADRAVAADLRRTDPRSHLRRLAGDLDWIVMKAIARDRERRYGSAEELAADLERYRDHRAVSAGPPTLAYRVRKLARRHRAGVAAAAIAAVALLAGTVATALSAQRARQEALRAEHEATAANRVVAFLTDMFDVASPGRSRGETLTAREILDRGRLKIGRELEGQPLIRARLMDAMGTIYYKLGLYEPAATLYEEALELRRTELSGEDPDTAESLLHLGEVRLRQHRLEEAGELLVAAHRIQRRAGAGDGPALAATLGGLAILARLEGRFDDAEDLGRRELEALEASVGVDHPDLARPLSFLGDLFRVTGRLEEAEAFFRRALDVVRELPEDHPSRAGNLGNLALVHLNSDRHDEAARLFERVVAIQEKALGPDHADLAGSLNNLALAHGFRGRYGEARQLLDRALGIMRRSLGPTHPNVGATLAYVGMVEKEAGRGAEAATAFRGALKIFEATLGPQSEPVAAVLVDLGLLAAAEGRLEDAEAKLARALAIRRTTLRPGDPGIADVDRELVRLRAALGEAPGGGA